MVSSGKMVAWICRSSIASSSDGVGEGLGTSTVRRRRCCQGREGDVGGDRAGVAGEDRSVGVAAAVGRLAGLQRRRCVGEGDSDARGAKEFVLVKLGSSAAARGRWGVNCSAKASPGTGTGEAVTLKEVAASVVSMGNSFSNCLTRSGS